MFVCLATDDEPWIRTCNSADQRTTELDIQKKIPEPFILRLDRNSKIKLSYISRQSWHIGSTHGHATKSSRDQDDERNDIKKGFTRNEQMPRPLNPTVKSKSRNPRSDIPYTPAPTDSSSSGLKDGCTLACQIRASNPSSRKRK